MHAVIVMRYLARNYVNISVQLTTILISTVLCNFCRESQADERLILVVGAGGDTEFSEEFGDWGETWRQVAAQQGWQCDVIGPVTSDAAFVEASVSSTGASDKELLQRAIISTVADQPNRVWVVLIGHGTFAANVAKFNLVGPDLTPEELDSWIGGIKTQVVLVNCSSSSSPFLTQLSGPHRIIVTATRSGSEINYSRFGKFMANAIRDSTADIDHDNEVSLLEAFLSASGNTERFYRDDARLASEHALLDDNHDKAGTSADFFSGILPVKKPVDGKELDGREASRIIIFSSENADKLAPDLVARRDEIERQIDMLRRQKDKMTEESYYNQLETYLLQIIALYE
ncbi:MAG: hypothetical protein KDB03_26480 [Planctomycetales bacterium]|nr:hypothetical protein [Planctomycetales bacterium]